MRRLLLLISVTLIALLPSAALAQVDVDEIALSLRADGYYVEAGATIDAATILALNEAEIPLYLVVLATDPGEDPSLTAERIASLFGSGTFVVRTPDFIGAYSVDYDDATVERALDDSLDGWRSSNADGLKGLERALTGKGGFPFGTVLVVGVAALIGWTVLRGRKRAERAAARRIEEARAALAEQADDVANDILALSDRVGVADNDVATDHYRQGNQIFSETQDGIAAASQQPEFEHLSAQLTQAEWHLEAVEAALDGRELPEQPTDRPVECFFHQHKAGVERAEIETPAGKKVISVCRECAERLRKGEAVEPRQVSIGGRRVPAGAAPRSYGGGGMNLDLFDVVLGGARTSYNWGGGRRSRTGAIPRVRSGGSRSRGRSSSRGRRSSSSKRGGGRASRRL